MSPPFALRSSGRVLLLGAALAAAACSSKGAATTAAGSTSGGTGGAGGDPGARQPDPPVTKDLQGRKYRVDVPKSNDGSKAVPLLVMLHGFTNGTDPATAMDTYMHISTETEKRGILLALPLGTFDKDFNDWSWNATDSCCGWDTHANDIGYLMAMIDEIKIAHKVDEKRIYVLGHSNGGFMANRLACDRASVFSGIVSLAGMTFKDSTKCAASAPIAMLHVHGDADTTVLYEGGPPYGILAIPWAPSAQDDAKIWAGKNHCKPTPDTSAAPIDLVTDLDGAETHKTIYQGCEANGSTELWTIKGGPHSPKFNSSWAGAVLDFLEAHPKP